MSNLSIGDPGDGGSWKDKAAKAGKGKRLHKVKRKRHIR